MGGPRDSPAVLGPAAIRGFDVNRRRILKMAGLIGLTGVATGPVAARSDGQDVTLVAADSGYGFNYPYYFYVPDTETSNERPLLVEPNNTGYTSDDFEDHRQSAQRLVQHGFCRRISDTLEVPLLVPVFPRPSSEPVDWKHYVHALDAETMHIESGKLERVDEQLLRMIDHAQETLAELSFPHTETIMLNGFSASGTFANRFTALHPEIVDSVSTGGINGTAILPRSNVRGNTTVYPIGIADSESLVGHSFDLERWQDVDQFVYLGGEDDNDTIPYDDAWSDEHRGIALAVYGEHMQEDRMPYCRAVYEDAGYTGRVTVFPGVGHGYSPGIEAEIIRFHRKHVGRFVVEFRNRPAAGSATVDVAAGTGSEPDVDSYEVRVFDATGADITASALSMDPGTGREGPVELTRELALDESVTVAIVASGETALGQAVASSELSVVGSVGFSEPPTTGGTEVTIEYQLSSRYAVEDGVSVRFDTEEGSSVSLTTIHPGEEGAITSTLDQDELGIPFGQARNLDARLVDGDPVDGETLARETTRSKTPDDIVIAITIDADTAVERGDELTIPVSVRGLAGADDALPITIEADGSVVTTETISIAAPDRERLYIPLDTDGFAGHDVTITVSGAGTSSQQTVILADEPVVGTGSPDWPYRITTGNELAYVDFDLDSHYTLANDIDLSIFDEFIRIGRLNDEFSGTFDGQFHEIQNLTLKESGNLYEGLGLFGNVKGGRIKNLHLVDVDVTGKGFVGGVVGVAAETGEISGVSVSGRVSGDTNVGGIIGGTTTGVNTGDVVISETVSHATVAGRDKVAGIIGQSSGDPVEKSAARGSITGNHGVGGIIGKSDFGGTVSECIVAADMDGDGGGIIGVNAVGSVTNAYWDIEKTGMSGTDGDGVGLTTAEMIGTAARENLSNFDFEETWRTVTNPDDYPKLRRLTNPPVTESLVDIEITSPEDRETVPEGRDLTVTVDVTNIGDRRASPTVVLTTPSGQLERDLTLDAGAQETIEFSISAADVTGTFLLTAETDTDAHSVRIRTGENAGNRDGGTAQNQRNGDGAETQPGTGILGTLVSLGGAGYLLKRRLSDEGEKE